MMKKLGLGHWTAIGFVLLVVIFAIVLWDLSNANRPHELKAVNLVTALVAIGCVVGVNVVRLTSVLWRARRSIDWRLARVSLVFLASIYCLLISISAVIVLTEYLSREL
jgi:hypothetical protein